MHKGQFKHSKAVVGKASPVHWAVLPSQVLHCHLNAFLAEMMVAGYLLWQLENVERLPGKEGNKGSMKKVENDQLL